MKVDKILRPKELHFHVPLDLAESINDLIAALEREDKDIDMYLDDLEGAARQVSEEHGRWINDYYVEYGWMKNVGND